ncbi:hypothetical protein DSCO28_65820 [Desulfosarcina ovata subsp. sediminis]|uniref:Lon proteolytic domain-containing protein n=1 Tax=Desulfosarcina ovata subsp. sediminis TaxID=885957 RepID=A0A5K8A0R7_9BACT|nr:hypothetical protein [Desulfosarcina ovata]BBO86016.1 hypothetical protein DSCO28_65820 [Desulfosarcina ovata subsp. sediminis]
MNSYSTQKTCSPTWILFESGYAVKVGLSLYSPPRETSRPIDAYVVTECENSFTKSARRAVEAVHGVANRFLPGLKPVVVGYDLIGLSATRQVTGESGGLAFAVALAKRFFGQDPGPVAATGVLRSGHNGGEIGAVKGIQAKLEGASILMPSGGVILYPIENEKDLPDSFSMALSEKGLVLKPVANVDEAIKWLFKIKGPEQPAKPRWRFLMIVLLILMAGSLGGYWLHKQDVDFDKVSKSEKATASKAPKTGSRSTESARENTNASIGTPALSPASPELWPKMEISTKTSLSKTIAGLFTQQFRRRVEAWSMKGDPDLRFTGNIQVVQMTEKEASEGKLRSEIIVSLRTPVVYSEKGRQSIAPIHVTVNGEGPAKSLMLAAADELALKLIDSLKNSVADHGFRGFK